MARPALLSLLPSFPSSTPRRMCAVQVQALSALLTRYKDALAEAKALPSATSAPQPITPFDQQSHPPMPPRPYFFRPARFVHS
jgi:hypothetical protein